MAITVQMIENKEFTTAAMGYKRKEVDMFLDEICDEMDRLNEEIQSLQLFKLVPFNEVFLPMVLTFGAAGLFVGMFGSVMSIRKFLDV